MPKIKIITWEEYVQTGEEIRQMFIPFNQKYCSDCIKANVDIAPPGHGYFFRTKEKGCCTTCANSQGYFSSIDHKIRASETIQFKLLVVKYHWSSLHGFFDLKKNRCKLEYHERSSACLNYYCIDHIIDGKTLYDKIRVIRNYRTQNKKEMEIY